MSNMDVFNLKNHIKDYLNEDNKEDLKVIVEEFQRGHFTNVLSKTKSFRENHEIDESLTRMLSLLDTTCLSQVGENKHAADIIMNLYQDSSEKSVDDLILYGNLAFMCDYKLSRRIMSDAVKQLEKEETCDHLKAAQAYLILGEAEENLKKFVRAIKYYKQSLMFFKKVKELDRQMIIFLHFKLGGLHSMIKETDEAISHLQKTIDLAKEGNNVEIIINSLVSIAKMYGTKEEFEQAAAYLKEAMPMLESSSLANKLVHAEAYTEMAYNHFTQSQYEEAVPNYEKAIAIHVKLPNYSARELGMIYMQYAYCLEHKKESNKLLASKNYEKAVEQLEKVKDHELLQNALVDIISFFENTDNQKKKRFYENKLVNLMNIAN